MSAWRRHLSTLLLCALCALAAVVYLIYDRGSISSREASRREGQLLPAWRREALSELVLSRDGEEVTLRREGADAGPMDFTMTPAGPIDPDALDRLLLALEFARFDRKVSGEPEAFGAEALSLQISMGSLAYELVLGGEAVTPKGARYLRLSQAKGASPEVLGVYVITEELAAELEIPLWELRSKQIVPYLSIALQGLTLERRDTTVALERVDAISFVLKPSGLRASRSALDRVWQALADSRLSRFAAPQTDAAEVTLRMQPLDGPAAELRFGGACPGDDESIVVSRIKPTPLSGCVPKEVLEGLSITEQALIDRSLFALGYDELTEIGAEVGALRLDLAREGGGFVQRAPVRRELQGQALNLLEASLRHWSALEGPVALGERGFTKLASVSVLATYGLLGREELREDLELGTCDGTRPCARRQRDGATVQLTPQQLARALPSPRWLEPLTLPAFAERPARIALECGQPQRLLRDDSTYRFEAPQAPGRPMGSASTAVDHERVLQLTDSLRRLQPAARLAELPFAVDYGFDCTVRVWSAEGAAPLELELGAISGDLCFARVTGSSEVFLVDAELRAAAARVYLERALWASDDPIEQVTLLHRGARRTLQLRTDAGAAAEVESLQRLRAEEALHHGPPTAQELARADHFRLELSGGATRRVLDVYDDGLVWSHGVGTFRVSSGSLDATLRVLGLSEPSGEPDAGVQ